MKHLCTGFSSKPDTFHIPIPEFCSNKNIYNLHYFKNQTIHGPTVLGVSLLRVAVVTIILIYDILQNLQHLLCIICVIISTISHAFSSSLADRSV